MRTALRTTLVAVTATATLGFAPGAVADQTARDGDTAQPGPNVSYGPTARACDTRGTPIAGTITITYGGNTHLTPGEGLQVTLTPPAGVTATAATTSVPPTWNANGQSFTIPLSTTVTTAAASGSIGFKVVGATSLYEVTPGGSQYGVAVDCPTNTAPTGVADSYTTAEDTPKVVAASGVLGNDTDPQGDALTAEKVSDPGHGTVALASDGSFAYTPAADYNGPDSFTYKAKDSGGLYSGVTTVSLNVTAVNDAPVARDDTASTDEEVAVDVAVLGNDTDAEGAALTVTGAGNGAHGVTAYDGDSVTYTPALNWFGVDSFTYDISDGSGGTDSATVTVTVSNVNDAPVATADSASTDEDTPLVVAAAEGVLANDSDVDGDALTAVLDSDATHGTVALAPDGSYSYTPDADFYGTDSFSYVANDGTIGSSVAVVTLTVAPVNDAPVVTAGPPASTQEGTPVAVSATFTDVDGAADETYTASIDWGDGSTSAGTVSGNQVTGTHTYADDEATPGDDIFQAVVTVTDSGTTKGASDPLSGTATVPVNVANVAPSVAAPALSVDPFSGKVTLSTTFTDPAGSRDTYAGSFSVDGVNVSGTVTGMTLSGETVLTPGCHKISATATVGDEDGGSSTSAATDATAGLDVYAVSFQAPIRDDVRNVAKYGNVLPVKVQVLSSCTGLPVTTSPLSIQVVKGNVTNDVTVDDTNAAVTESVSNADSGSQMRVADGKYIYNLSTKGLTVGSDYTIRIRQGASSTTGTIILRALLSTKK